MSVRASPPFSCETVTVSPSELFAAFRSPGPSVNLASTDSETQAIFPEGIFARGVSH